MLPRMPEFEVNYRGAVIRIVIETDAASLHINGLERDKKALGQDPRTLKLSSSVQTDYEWHEFIESTLEVEANQVRVELVANNQPLLSETVDRP